MKPSSSFWTERGGFIGARFSNRRVACGATAPIWLTSLRLAPSWTTVSAARAIAFRSLPCQVLGNLRRKHPPRVVVLRPEGWQAGVQSSGLEILPLRDPLPVHPVARIAARQPSAGVPLPFDPVLVAAPPVSLDPDALLVLVQPPLEAMGPSRLHIIDLGQV